MELFQIKLGRQSVRKMLHRMDPGYTAAQGRPRTRRSTSKTKSPDMDRLDRLENFGDGNGDENDANIGGGNGEENDDNIGGGNGDENG